MNSPCPQHPWPGGDDHVGCGTGPTVDGGGPGAIELVREGGHLLVVLDGEIDAAYRHELAEAAAAVVAAGLPVRVLADRVSFMDSTGAAFLARIATGSAPRVVTVVAASTQVRFLLDVTGLATLLTLEDPA